MAMASNQEVNGIQPSVGHNGNNNDTQETNHINDIFRKDHLQELWRSRLLCDIVLKAKQEEFHAHRAILALTSKYFWQKLVLAQSPASTGELKVMVDPKMLKILLEYIYEGRLEITEENVEKLYQANLILDVVGVTEKCSAYMMLHIDDGNWDKRFRFARTQKCGDLIDLVIYHVSQDYLYYLRTPQFLDMRKEDIIGLLNIPERLNHPEEEIFDCVLKWLKFNEEERARDAPDLIKELDYATLSPQFLKQKFESERVLNSIACSKILQEALGQMEAVTNQEQNSTQRQDSTVTNGVASVTPRDSLKDSVCGSSSNTVPTSQDNDSGNMTLPSSHASTVTRASPTVTPSENGVRHLSQIKSSVVVTVAEEPPEKRSRPTQSVTPVVIKAVARKSTGGVKKQQFTVEKAKLPASSSDSACSPSPEIHNGPSVGKKVTWQKSPASATPATTPANASSAPVERRWNPHPLGCGHHIVYFRTGDNGEVRLAATDLGVVEPQILRPFIGSSNPTLVWVPQKRRVYALGGITTYEQENSSSKETRYITDALLFKAGPKERNWWYKGPEMHQERTNFQAVVLGDYIYAFGGAEGPCGNEAVNCAEKLSVVRKVCKWEETDYLQRARHSFGAGVINGKIYVCGGYGSQDDSEEPKMGILNSVECYDPVKDEWKFVASMMNERWGHAVTVLDDKLYAIGGGGIHSHTDPENDISNMKSVEVYDPREDSWTLVSPMIRPRKSASAVAIDGKIYVIGGDFSDGENTLLSSVEMYDPVRDKWTMCLDKVDEKGSFVSVALIDDQNAQ